MTVALTCQLCGCRYFSGIVTGAEDFLQFDARHECTASREASRHDGYGTQVVITLESTSPAKGSS
jgi:hypothetical protein